jgi:hypothetical protein
MYRRGAHEVRKFRKCIPTLKSICILNITTVVSITTVLPVKSYGLIFTADKHYENNAQVIQGIQMYY